MRASERDRLEEALPLVGCFWCERLHPGEHALSVCPPCRAKYETLQSLGMSRAYRLSDQTIDETLMRAAPGSYALGYMDGDAFLAFYVGRSDSDLRERILRAVDLTLRARLGATAGTTQEAIARATPQQLQRLVVPFVVVPLHVRLLKMLDPFYQ